MAKNQKQLKDALSWQRNDINYTECDKSFMVTVFEIRNKWQSIVF